MGKGTNTEGVKGEGYPGVYGKSTATAGTSPGVQGDAVGPNSTGVLGRNAVGHGGYFIGGRAQLRLAPGSIVGRPTSGAHVKDEIFMDSRGFLYVCMANGTPGTWRIVGTTPA